MKGLQSIHGALVKAFGAKAAAGITVAAVTVTSAAGIGAIGFAGYQVAEYVREQSEDEELLSYGTEISSRDSYLPEEAEERESKPSKEGDNPVIESINNDSRAMAKEHAKADMQENNEQKNGTANNKTSGNNKKQNQAKAESEETADNNSKPIPEIQPEPEVQPIPQTKQKPKPIKTQTESQESGKDEGSDEPSPSEPVPTTPVHFINKKVNGLIVPDTFKIDTEVYKKLYYTSDEYDRMSTKPYTIMIYLCGTDLESTGSYGDGTKDILKMLSQQYDMSKVNVLLCAGGTTTWKNTYMGAAGEDGCNNDNVRCNIYYLNPESTTFDGMTDREKIGYDKTDEETINQCINGDTLKLLVSLDPTDMGEDELLAGFMDFAADYFPADNYGAILWNHGGGINEGVCYSEDNEEVSVTGTSITADELEAALASSTLGKEGKKLGFIGFDACLMGSTELAYNLAPYSEYMIGSMELSSGGWYYGDIFQYISDQAKSDSINNKEIALEIADKYYTTHKTNTDQVASIACYDLSAVQDTVDQINKISSDILELYNGEKYPDYTELTQQCFKMLKQARIHSYENGTDKNQSRFQYVDQNSFYTNLQAEINNLIIEYGNKAEGEPDEEKKEEINKIILHFDSINEEIEELLKNDSLLLYAGAHYYGKDVFKKTEGGSITYSDFWTELKGEDIGGTSIYMPSSSNTADNANVYQQMNLMEDYTSLLSKYMEQINGQAEKERINQLTKTIDYTDVLEEPTLKKTADGTNYLQVQIKSEYAGEVPEGRENPYTDFMDTVDAITVYVSNYQEMESESKEKYGVNLVIAKTPVDMADISGKNEQINVNLDSLDGTIGWLATGKTSEEENEVYDWARTSNLEKNEKIKNATLDKLKDQFLAACQDIQEQWDNLKWMTFGGKAYTTGEDNQEQVSDAILYFYETTKKDADNKEYSYYTYAGAEATVEEMQGNLVKDVNAISFYHYIVDENNHEERYDNLDQKLQVSDSDEVCIYEKYIVYDSEMKKYNDYTIGVDSKTYQDEKGDNLYQEFILATGKAPQDENKYEENPYQIGYTVKADTAQLAAEDAVPEGEEVTRSAEVITEAGIEAESADETTTEESTESTKLESISETITEEGTESTESDSSDEVMTEENTELTESEPIDETATEESIESAESELTDEVMTEGNIEVTESDPNDDTATEENAEVTESEPINETITEENTEVTESNPIDETVTEKITETAEENAEITSSEITDTENSEEASAEETSNQESSEQAPQPMPETNVIEIEAIPVEKYDMDLEEPTAA